MLTGVLTAAWAASNRSAASRLRWAPWLPFALGAITVAAANAAATAGGWPLIVFAFIAALSAASETSVIAGSAILALGLLAVEAGGLLYGASSSTVFGFPLLLFVGFLAGHDRRAYRVRAEQSALCRSRGKRRRSPPPRRRAAPGRLLLDLHMPVLDGIETTRALAKHHPGVAIVILTTYADDDSVLAALRAGARSYLTKDADRTDIARALNSAAAGLSVLDAGIQAALIAGPSATTTLHPPLLTTPPTTCPTASPHGRSRSSP